MPIVLRFRVPVFWKHLLPSCMHGLLVPSSDFVCVRFGAITINEENMTIDAEEILALRV